MTILLVDTSIYPTVIVTDSKGLILSEVKSSQSNKHVEELCSIAQKSIVEAKTPLQKLQHLCVIDFPGGYTSIRVGLSFVNALKFVFNKPIFSISKFDVLANLSDTEPPYVLIIQNNDNDYMVKIVKDKKTDLVKRIDRKAAIDLKNHYKMIGDADFLAACNYFNSQNYADFVIKFLQNNFINGNNKYLKTSRYTCHKYNKS